MLGYSPAVTLRPNLNGLCSVPFRVSLTLIRTHDLFFRLAVTVGVLAHEAMVFNYDGVEYLPVTTSVCMQYVCTVVA